MYYLECVFQTCLDRDENKFFRWVPKSGREQTQSEKTQRKMYAGGGSIYLLEICECHGISKQLVTDRKASDNSISSGAGRGDWYFTLLLTNDTMRTK